MGNPVRQVPDRVAFLLQPAGQHRSLNRTGPKFSDRRIDGKISFSPAALWVGQLRLPVETMPINELFHPNPDTPDPCPLHAEPLVERQGLRRRSRR